MKRAMAVLSVIIAIFTINTTYAYTVNDPSIINELNEGETYVNGEIRTDITDIQFVGNGYLVFKKNDNAEKMRYFTKDFQNFREVSVFNDRQSYPHSRVGVMDEIKWADGVYLARSNVYDVPQTSGRVMELNGYLYVLDRNFQFVNKIEFDYYVREMSFINGIYYVRISNESFLRANRWTSTKDDIVDKVYETTDLDNWTEREDLKHVPMTNGNNTITLKDNKIYTFINGQINNQIVFEEVTIQGNSGSSASAQQILNVAGEYFYIVDNNTEYGENAKVWISVDGIYMTKYTIDTNEIECGVNSLNDKFGHSYIKKEDIDRYLLTGDTYIQLNNKILGFSQPPVVESDRTLVPMRFLFEQMGASVDWNETTQSVTATVPTSTETQIQTFGLEQEKSVTFSIDNNTASVNGESETMDVPARLINDQTFVPLRFLSESLGYDVQWDDTTNTAIVTTE